MDHPNPARFRHRRHLCLPAIAGSLLGASGAHHAGADELWRQQIADCNALPNVCYGGLASQDSRNAVNGWMYEAVDNFDAAEGWIVTSLEFWGTYSWEVPANTHGFMIRIYADDGGSVGQLLLTQDVLSFTRNVHWTWNLLPYSSYHYTLDLVQPFIAPAPGRYWIGIVAIQDYGGSQDRQWFWNHTQSANLPYCQQSTNPPGGHSSQSYDLAFVLHGAAETPCYANCDGSTVEPILNVDDFTCFINEFAQAQSLPHEQQIPHYANCDGSTVAPVLNVDDFTCFINAFAQGCP